MKSQRLAEASILAEVAPKLPVARGLVGLMVAAASRLPQSELADHC